MTSLKMLVPPFQKQINKQTKNKAQVLISKLQEPFLNQMLQVLPQTINQFRYYLVFEIFLKNEQTAYTLLKAICLFKSKYN